MVNSLSLHLKHVRPSYRLWHFEYLIDTYVFSEWNGEIDGDSGTAIAISTLKAIYGSRKILLVITEHFLTSDWPLLKTVIDNTIKHRPESIVLILLGKCHIPKEIQQLPVFDLTMRSRIPFEIQKLKCTLT